MKLLENDILSQDNFDNLLVSPRRELTMENFTEFSRNFEMPLNRGFEIYLIFYAMPIFHFHGGAAYFRDRHSQTGAYDKHFSFRKFPKTVHL